MQTDTNDAANEVDTFSAGEHSPKRGRSRDDGNRDSSPPGGGSGRTVKMVKRSSYSRSPSSGPSRKVSYRDRSSRYDRDRDRDRRYRSRSPRSRSPRRSSYKSSSRYSSHRRSSRSYSRGHSHSKSPMSSRRRHVGTRDNPTPSRCLGVFGLSVNTTESEIHHMFAQYGPVERVQVVIDAKTGHSRGFCFVYFESSEDSKVAKEKCNGIKLGGKHIRVDFSITQRAHTPTPGIYMGKPTSMSSSSRSSWNDRGSRRRDREGSTYRDRRSISPSYSRRSRRYERSRSRSYSPRRY